MSNFTKSVVYSTTVLAVGLVAIFAIYNNVTTSSNTVGMASISPASGENDVSGMITDVILSAAENTESAINNGASMLNDMAVSSGEAIAELGNDAMDAVEGANDTVAETVSEAVTDHDAVEGVSIMDAASEEASDAVTDAVDEHVEVPAVELNVPAVEEAPTEKAIDAAQEKAVDTLNDAVSD